MRDTSAFGDSRCGDTSVQALFADPGTHVLTNDGEKNEIARATSVDDV